MVNALQYCAITRSEIAYSVNKLCQFLHATTNFHSNFIKRLLRYLRGTTSHGLYLHKLETLQLVAYTDANWVACVYVRRSTG